MVEEVKTLEHFVLRYIPANEFEAVKREQAIGTIRGIELVFDKLDRRLKVVQSLIPTSNE